MSVKMGHINYVTSVAGKLDVFAQFEKVFDERSVSHKWREAMAGAQGGAKQEVWDRGDKRNYGRGRFSAPWVEEHNIGYRSRILPGVFLDDYPSSIMWKLSGYI